MPDVQEVFRVATQKVRPDPGALERQQDQQRRHTMRRKAGAYALAAAVFAAIAVVAVRAAVDSSEPNDVGTQPSRSTPIFPTVGPVGTVTADGTTCSIEMTADPIEPGAVVFEVVNDTDQRAMFDSWDLAEGFTFQAFEGAVERDLQNALRGDWNAKGGFPKVGEKIFLLSSDVIPPHSTDTIVASMSSGTHAIVCLKPFEGHGFRPYGIAGPITVP